MNNITRLITLASLLTSSQLLAADRPNILILLADQWRATATGYAGDPNVKTPHLDRLAHEGLNFTNAVSVCPVCTPYRAALMTGRFPTSTGMFLNDASLPLSEICLADLLKSAGYATAYIGKWHLDGHGRESFIPPDRRHGWDYWKVAECDHDYNHSHYYDNDSPVKRYWEGYDAFAQTQDAQAYIRQHAATNQPFALMVAYGAPHFPHNSAPKQFQDLYPPDQIKLPANVPPALQKPARREAQGYYAHCSALDQCIGDLMKTLAETHLADKTILLFTSDHGEMLGAHGCHPFMKQVPWNEASHVPLLLRYPAAQPQAGTITTPLTTPDLFTTLLSLANVPLPKTAEGQDLSPLLRDPASAPDRAALYMGVAPFAGGEFSREYRAIRTSRYTYVRNLQGPWLLYDDQTDPLQQTNLVSNPQYAQLQATLDAQLQAELQRIHDPFLPGDHYIKTWNYHVTNGKSIPYNNPSAPPQSPHRSPN